MFRYISSGTTMALIGYPLPSDSGDHSARLHDSEVQKTEPKFCLAI
jgi:hypothetical protein